MFSKEVWQHYASDMGKSTIVVLQINAFLYRVLNIILKISQLL